MNDGTMREYLRYPRPLWRWLLHKSWVSFVMLPWCAFFAITNEHAIASPWWVRLISTSFFAMLFLFHVQTIAHFVGFYRARESSTRWWAEFSADQRKRLASRGVSSAVIDQVLEHLLDDDPQGALNVLAIHPEEAP